MSKLTALLRARYGSAAPPTIDTRNPTLATLLAHRSFAPTCPSRNGFITEP